MVKHLKLREYYQYAGRVNKLFFVVCVPCLLLLQKAYEKKRKKNISLWNCLAGDRGVLFYCEYKKSINGPHSLLGNCFNTLGFPLLVNIARPSVNFSLYLNIYTFTDGQGNINNVWNNAHHNKKIGSIRVTLK